MTEAFLLNLFLVVASALAPLMTARFFLAGSRFYPYAHGLTLVVLGLAELANKAWLVAAWPLFCGAGFCFYLWREGRALVSAIGAASCIPFLFSLISATWFFAGANDLHLLGYGQSWSFYAALHGSFLGWIFTGCLAILARTRDSDRIYLAGCFATLIFFLFVAFGIDGEPYIKRVGVVGFSILVPLMIFRYRLSLRKEDVLSKIFVNMSLISIFISMSVAVLNEFWPAFPKHIFGLPLMVVVHGALNTVIAMPCFYFGIRCELRAGPV